MHMPFLVAAMIEWEVGLGSHTTPKHHPLILPSRLQPSQMHLVGYHYCKLVYMLDAHVGLAIIMDTNSCKACEQQPV